MIYGKATTSLVRIALILAVLALAGCNTTAGMGEDLEAAGSAIDREATEAKGY
jgi:predicted small secreted protein